MKMNFQRRTNQTRFENWLTESVYTGPGITTAMRQTVLYQFTLDLISFHKNFGYSITRSPVDVARDLARFIFKTKLVSRSKIVFNRNLDERPEDYDMYLHNIGSEDWIRFFQAYAHMDDFDCSDSNGRFITYSIPCFAWYNVNINNSAATHLLDQQLAFSDSDSDDGGRPRRRMNRAYDPYLTDQQNNVSKFNRWD
jgi:hypothetical protein